MDAISRIHGYLKFGVVLGLERMNKLMEKLGNPQDSLDVIHVAGTNGKGSVCRYIYEILRETGCHAGLYTSPYIEEFNERIEFDGKRISDDELESAAKTVCDAADEMLAAGMDSPTEFEIVTAMAFLYFKQKGCDYVVLEVGLGGRGDSTNIVKKTLCSVITSISLDHTDRLGETIPEIAGEKAGIIKETCPVIVGAKDEEAKAVIRKRATEMNAPMFDATVAFPVIKREDIRGSSFTVEVLDKEYRGIEISMAGRHQIDNAVCALYAIEVLRRQGKLEVSTAEIRKGMRAATNMGRLELISDKPCILIDGAHNFDGARVLKETVLRNFEGKRILMVVGMLADKEVKRAAACFSEMTSDFIVTEPANPRALKTSDFAQIITKLGCHCEEALNPVDAVDKALARRDKYDLIVFAGSLYLIGDIRRELARSTYAEVIDKDVYSW